MIIQKKIAQYSIEHLGKILGEDWKQNEHLNNLNERLQLDVSHFNREMEKPSVDGNSLVQFQHAYLKLLEYQRDLLNQMNQRAEFDEEIIRKYLSLIDLEEFKLREKILPVDPV
jgi:CPA1 family monovalent cation:H+ antiporter